MKRVLIVDDAAFMRATIKNMLMKNGFEIVGEAVNGYQGIQLYFESKPDLVTMDITMPELDGIGAVKVIKERDPSAKVIMLSAMGQETFVRDAVLAGASTFLVKPFKEELLLNAIKQVLGE